MHRYVHVYTSWRCLWCTDMCMFIFYNQILDLSYPTFFKKPCITDSPYHTQMNRRILQTQSWLGHWEIYGNSAAITWNLVSNIAWSFDVLDNHITIIIIAASTNLPIIYLNYYNITNNNWNLTFISDLLSWEEGVENETGRCL